MRSLHLGINGGRDDFGGAVHMDTEGRGIIFMENAGVGKVGANARQVTEVMGMTPFHGDLSQGMH